MSTNQSSISSERSFNTLSRKLASSFNPYIDQNSFSTTLQNVCHGISMIQDLNTDSENFKDATCIGINSYCKTLMVALDWESSQPARTNNLDLSGNARVIQSRDDLSFTSRDSEGRINNWDVSHDRNGDWHKGLIIGEKYFDEVKQLALFDVIEAFHAIEFPLNSGQRQSSGWGIEMGFTQALAKAAILGMRQLHQGAVEIDEAAHTK